MFCEFPFYLPCYPPLWRFLLHKCLSSQVGYPAEILNGFFQTVFFKPGPAGALATQGNELASATGVITLGLQLQGRRNVVFPHFLEWGPAEIMTPEPCHLAGAHVPARVDVKGADPCTAIE